MKRRWNAAAAWSESTAVFFIDGTGHSSRSGSLDVLLGPNPGPAPAKIEAVW